MLCCDVAQQLYLHCILQFNKAALISMQCSISLECPLPSWNPLPFNLLKSKYIQKHLLPLLAFPSRKYQQYKICLYILLCHFFNKKQICNNVNHVHQESGTPAFSAPFCPKKTHYFCQQHCSSSPRFFTELEFLVDHNVDCTAVLHLQADTRPIVYTVQQPTGVLSTSFQIQKVCISLAERNEILPLQTVFFFLTYYYGDAQLFCLPSRLSISFFFMY